MFEFGEYVYDIEFYPSLPKAVIIQLRFLPFRIYHLETEINGTNLGKTCEETGLAELVNQGNGNLMSSV